MEPVISRIQATVDDEDVDTLDIRFVLKDGKTLKGLDTLFHERVLFKYLLSNCLPWAKYVRDRHIKTF